MCDRRLFGQGAVKQKSSILSENETLPAKRKRAGNSNGSPAEREPPAKNETRVRKVYANNKAKTSLPQVEEPIGASREVNLEGKKMHWIKLKSHDGKDLGYMKLFMKPEQVKMLNGRIIKVAKLNSINQVNSLASNKPSSEKTISYQLVASKVDEPAVPTVARKKEIVVPKIAATSVSGDLTCRAISTLKSSTSTPTITSVSSRFHEQSAQKDVQPRVAMISKANGSGIRIVKLPARAKMIPPARQKAVAQKREFVVVEGQHPGVKVEMKNDEEMLINIQSSVGSEKTCAEEQDPLADPLASSTVAETINEDNQKQPLRIIKHPIKRLADKNPVLASFLGKLSTSTPKENIAKPVETDPRKEESLSVIQEAMDSISDKSLRDKALKALAECGLRVVRHLPIVPEAPKKTVCESDAQTEVFGLLDEESFVLAEEKSLDLKRIPQKAQELSKSNMDASVQVEAAEFEPSIADIPIISVPDTPSLDCIDLETFFNNWSVENSEVSKVKNVLSKQDKRITETLAAQLRRDFDSIKMYGEDGMLGIHRAVVENNPAEVRRLLFMLKACQEDANVETAKGVTCLELAISSGASSEIVSALLKAGATPVSARLVHDSAIILASKQSSCHLRDLIAYVKDPFLLNLTGPEGFSALHYCAMLGNLDGVRILLDAGANFNMRDSRSGRTALFHAVENNHVKISALLYEKGAAVTTPNFSGQTVLSLLQDTTNSRLRKTFSQVLSVGQRS